MSPIENFVDDLSCLWFDNKQLIRDGRAVDASTPAQIILNGALHDPRTATIYGMLADIAETGLGDTGRHAFDKLKTDLKSGHKDAAMADFLATNEGIHKQQLLDILLPVVITKYGIEVLDFA